MKNNNEIIDEYKKVNLDISNRIITISLTVIAAIFVICDKYGIYTMYLISLLVFVVTIGTNLAQNICYSKHYEQALDGKIKNIDFRNSPWGKWAERLYWCFIFLFVISILCFIGALLETIILQFMWY
jgi:ABC-type Fe3+ transport system permease subunit